MQAGFSVSFQEDDQNITRWSPRRGESASVDTLCCECLQHLSFGRQSFRPLIATWDFWTVSDTWHWCWECRIHDPAQCLPTHRRHIEPDTSPNACISFSIAPRNPFAKYIKQKEVYCSPHETPDVIGSRQITTKTSVRPSLWDRGGATWNIEECIQYLRETTAMPILAVKLKIYRLLC